MHNNDLALILDFQHRYKKLSDTSGYALVYDTLALIREFIPCKEIGFSIAKPKSEDIEDVEPGSVPLCVATPLIARTQNLFYGMLNHIGYTKRSATKMMRQLVAGDPVETLGFDDDAQCAKGVLHDFFTKLVKVSDVAYIAGLIDRHQFIRSPFTQSYYSVYCCMARADGLTYNSREKQLFALLFGIFLQDFKEKIRCPENSPFLPYVTGEKIDGKTKLEALFDTGTKFSPRELATIKTCFDLKQQKREVTRPAVARFLHLQDKDNCTAQELKKAVDKVDYDLKKIKGHLLRDFEHDTTDNYNSLSKQFELEHITDVFKTYAYFGLYPDKQKRFLSYLSNRLEK